MPYAKNPNGLFALFFTAPKVTKLAFYLVFVVALLRAVIFRFLYSALRP
jgi:hypothetical protein